MFMSREKSYLFGKYFEASGLFFDYNKVKKK